MHKLVKCAMTGTLKGMVMHEGPVTDRSTQQFVVAADAALTICCEEEVTRQMGLQGGWVSASNNNGLTLVEVGLEPQVGRASLRVSNGTNNSNRTSQDSVVKEERKWKGQLARPVRSSRASGCMAAANSKGPRGSPCWTPQEEAQRAREEKCSGHAARPRQRDTVSGATSPAGGR